MKYSIVLLTLVSNVAFAGWWTLPSQNDSWETIIGKRNICRADFPQIPTYVGDGTLYMHYYHFCYEAQSDSLRAEVDYCTKYEQVGGTEGFRECVESEKRTVRHKREYKKSVCTDYNSESGCSQWKSVDAAHPLSLDIDVYESRNSDYEDFLFTKRYQVPNCQ